MIKTGKCFVQIFGKKDRIITFDFGSFAIVIEYVPEKDSKDSKEFILYYGDDYIKDFMGGVCEIIDENSTYNVIIRLKAFRDIEIFIRNRKIIERGTNSYEKMWSLLENNFSGYIKKYGF